MYRAVCNVMYVYGMMMYSVIASVSEDEAQEALFGAVSQRCCYGKAAVNEMDIYQIISTCALHVS